MDKEQRLKEKFVLANEFEKVKGFFLDHDAIGDDLRDLSGSLWPMKAKSDLIRPCTFYSLKEEPMVAFEDIDEAIDYIESNLNDD